MNKKSFTLLELLIVTIIIAILVALGQPGYVRTMEKARSAEAKANLGTIRQLQRAFWQENNTYAVLDSTTDNLGTGLPGGTDNTDYTCVAGSNYFFEYFCAGGATTTCSACRCTTNGRLPAAAAGYRWDITLGAASGITCGVAICP